MNNKVLFVGSFKEKTSDGGVGGQMFASRSLIYSSIAKEIDFIKLDSTALSIPPKPVFIRLFIAFKRLFLLLNLLLIKQPATVLIFTSSGFSFLEKGLMALMAKIVFRKRVIFAPRSGLIKQDIEKSNLFKRFLLLVFKKVDIVMCQGKEWKSYYVNETDLPENKFIIQRNWLDVSEYIEIKRNNEVLSLKVKLLYISWVEPYKGIKELIEVMRRLKDEEQPFELDIYGSGSLSTWLVNQIVTDGLQEFVKYHGWANHETKMKALSKADIFVLPSYAEGIPNSLLEAMASQLACISTDVGGIPSILENNVNGLMIHSESVDELYVAIKELIINPNKRVKLATEARKYVIKEHHIENLTGKIKSILLP